jgi:PAS domain S-box-containing protein
VAKDLDGIITSWNAGAERIFGYMAEEIIGKPITILIPPDYQKEQEAQIVNLAHEAEHRTKNILATVQPRSVCGQRCRERFSMRR